MRSGVASDAPENTYRKAAGFEVHDIECLIFKSLAAIWFIIVASLISD